MSIMTFDVFTDHLKWIHNDATKEMAYERKRFANPEADLSQLMKSYHDDAMRATATLRLTTWLVQEHEALCLESLESERDEAWWDATVDARFLKPLYATVMQKAWQGVSSSSNPLTIVAELYEYDAHRKVLSHFIGYNPVSGAIVDDIFVGMNRRAAEHEAAQAKAVRKVHFYKAATGWAMESRNRANEMVERIYLANTITRKTEARKAAEVWANELYAKTKVSTTVVEGL